MAKKEFKYKGKSVEELKQMSAGEFAQIAPASTRRKIKRGLTPENKILLKKMETKKKPVKTHCRDMIILPEMIDKSLQVYNGKTFVSITITPEMVGHYLGEFSLSRNRVAHSSPGVGATKSSSHVSVK